jgi:GH25 family lysozyme M1 (1,4-beta-N-acetylmuramidase)
MAYPDFGPFPFFLTRFRVLWRFMRVGIVLALGLLLTAVASGSVCPGPSTLQGVTVSQYNGSIDWGQAASSGIAFGYARATVGAAYVDPTFATNFAGMKSAGLAPGAYHFFHSNVDPNAQAANFLQTIGTLGPGDLPPMVDVEVSDGQTAAVIAARLQTWVSIVQEATGRTPVIYTSASFWKFSLGGNPNFASNPLWVANWGVICPSLPSPWQTWTFWEYSDLGQIPGIGPTVSLDMFNGSQADLDRLTVGPFESFNAALIVTANGFRMSGDIRLGDANHPIHPPQETVTIQVGTQVITIPPGSFQEKNNGLFIFAGHQDGIDVTVTFRPIAPDHISFGINAFPLDLSALPNPVKVVLTIGNQRGTALCDIRRHHNAFSGVDSDDEGHGILQK